MKKTIILSLVLLGWIAASPVFAGDKTHDYKTLYNQQRIENKQLEAAIYQQKLQELGKGINDICIECAACPTCQKIEAEKTARDAQQKAEKQGQ